MKKIKKILLIILLITIIFLLAPIVNGYSEIKSITKIEDLTSVFDGQIEEDIFKLETNTTLNDTKINFELGTYTIDLNGINIEMINSVFNICGGNLTIIDSSLEKKSTIKSNCEIIIVENGNLTIENGNYETCDLYDVIDIYSGTLIINNGSFKAEYGRALYMSGGSVKVNDGFFISSGIMATIGVFSDEKVSENDFLIINNGEFVCDLDTGSEPGFAIYISGASEGTFPITINNGNFKSLYGPGMDINTWNSNIIINEGKFKGISAGVCITTASNVNINGGYFEGYSNGLFSFDKIELAGGTFKSLNRQDESYGGWNAAAIFLYNYNQENFDIDKGINQILKNGYEFLDDSYYLYYDHILSTELELTVQKIKKYNVSIKNSENGKILIDNIEFSIV